MNLIDKFHHWRRKLRWNKQYKSGRWDSLESDKEAKRYEKIISCISNYAPANPSVLDVGCGDGVLTLRMQGGYSYFLGVDFSSVSVEKAKARNLVNSEFLAADAIKFKPERNFDAIVLNEVFYYIHDSEKINVMDRLLNALNDNGVLVVSIYREGIGCWEYFRENPKLEELEFETVRTDEELRYWKVAAYRKT